MRDDEDKNKAKKIVESLKSDPKKKRWGKDDWGSMENALLFLFYKKDRQHRTLQSTKPLSRKLVEEVLKGEKCIYVYDGSHYWFMNLRGTPYITSNCEYICNKFFKRDNKTIAKGIQNQVKKLVNNNSSSQLKALHTGYTKIIDKINNIVINNKFIE